MNSYTVPRQWWLSEFWVIEVWLDEQMGYVPAVDGPAYATGWRAATHIIDTDTPFPYVTRKLAVERAMTVRDEICPEGDEELKYRIRRVASTSQVDLGQTYQVDLPEKKKTVYETFCSFLRRMARWATAVRP